MCMHISWELINMDKMRRIWTLNPENRIEGEAIRQLKRAGSLPGMLRAVGLSPHHKPLIAPLHESPERSLIILISAATGLVDIIILNIPGNFNERLQPPGRFRRAIHLDQLHQHVHENQAGWMGAI